VETFQGVRSKILLDFSNKDIDISRDWLCDGMTGQVRNRYLKARVEANAAIMQIIAAEKEKWVAEARVDELERWDGCCDSCVQDRLATLRSAQEARKREL
jgi:hypothetical protein